MNAPSRCAGRSRSQHWEFGRMLNIEPEFEYGCTSGKCFSTNDHVGKLTRTGMMHPCAIGARNRLNVAGTRGVFGLLGSKLNAARARERRRPAYDPNLN